MSLTRPIDLLAEAVSLLRQLVEAAQAQPVRGLNESDLLTVEEVRALEAEIERLEGLLGES